MSHALQKIPNLLIWLIFDESLYKQRSFTSVVYAYMNFSVTISFIKLLKNPVT